LNMTQTIANQGSPFNKYQNNPKLSSAQNLFNQNYAARFGFVVNSNTDQKKKQPMTLSSGHNLIPEDPSLAHKEFIYLSSSLGSA